MFLDGSLKLESDELSHPYQEIDDDFLRIFSVYATDHIAWRSNLATNNK